MCQPTFLCIPFFPFFFSELSDVLVSCTYVYMTLTVLLVRHGETVDNIRQIYAGTRDSECAALLPSKANPLCTRLTVHGMAQAKALADSLKHEPVSHIFCSDLKRASRTAAAIAEHHSQIVAIPDQLFREQDFGELEGQCWRETWTADAASRARAIASFGESNVALAERASLAWDWVLRQVSPMHEHQFVVIISHGRLLRSLLTSICRYYDTPRPPNVYWGNASYVRLSVISGRAPVLVFDRVNESGHLTSLQRQKGGVGSSTFDESQKTIDLFFSPSPEKK